MLIILFVLFNGFVQVLKGKERGSNRDTAKERTERNKREINIV